MRACVQDWLESRFTAWLTQSALTWLCRYDRGHLAPAADHKGSQKAMEETFTLSNISPQVGKGFNRCAAARCSIASSARRGCILSISAR